MSTGAEYLDSRGVQAFSAATCFPVNCFGTRFRLGLGLPKIEAGDPPTIRPIGIKAGLGLVVAVTVRSSGIIKAGEGQLVEASTTVTSTTTVCGWGVVVQAVSFMHRDGLLWERAAGSSRLHTFLLLRSRETPLGNAALHLSLFGSEGGEVQNKGGKGISQR